MKVWTIFGTRPEAIKMAPVARALAQDSSFDARIVVTGQHRQMLDQVLSSFELVVDDDLAIMRPGQDLTDVTTAVLTGLRDRFRVDRPDIVLVHGDTTSCLAATLAAFYASVPVGHVEAGLRTGDLRAPWPEEANRVLTDRLATLLFAPTPGSADALRAEGVPEQRIVVTGNTVIDALLWRVEANRRAPFEPAPFGAAASIVADNNRRIVLVTGHRRESFGQGFEDLCHGIRRVAETWPDVAVIYPVHLNPNVQEPVHRLLGGLPNVLLIPPLEYAPFVRLMERCTLILTDSGGIQEEAPSLGKPVLVMRDVTERPEGVAAGTVKLVGTSAERIFEEVDALLRHPSAMEAFRRTSNPYGDGRAAGRIVEALRAWKERT